MGMTDTRPILLGTHNPLSDSPLMALWPDPEESTGWWIWQMLGCSQEEYIRGWDRRNLLNSVEWDGGEAQRVGLDVWERTEGRRVIILGLKVYFHLLLPDNVEFIFPNFDDTGREWRIVPDFTKKVYYDPTLRLRVALLLKDWHDNWVKEKRG